MLWPVPASKAAVDFLEGQPRPAGPAELPQLLASASAYLQSRYPLKLQEAHDIAVAAWAELDAKSAGCSFDLERSTPYVVYLHDQATGMCRPIPVTDILRFLGPREVTAKSAPRRA